MRKLTGYVGAMIVVMALMGSILAGYAININGRTAIVNDYEAVTDVSGLYNYSQEKNFIEYNPASNYIGYQTVPETYTNEVVNPNERYKSISNGTVTITKNVGISIGGSAAYPPPNDSTTGYNFYWWMITNKYFGYGAISQPIVWGPQPIGIQNNFTKLTVTVNLPTITYNFDGTNYTTTGNTIFLIYDPLNYDYIGQPSSQNVDKTFYIKDGAKIAGIANSNVDGNWGTFVDSTFTDVNNISRTITTTTAGTEIAPGVKEREVLASVSNYTQVMTLYPLSATSDTTLGIKYTETSRVNNYPIEKEYSSNTQTTTLKMNLSKGMTADYSPAAAPYLGQSYFNESNSGGGRSYYDLNLYGPTYLPNRAVYKLSDLLNTISLPDGTTQIVFETGSASGETWVTLPASEGGGNDYGGRVALNKTRFGTLNNGVVSSTDTLITNTGYDGYRAVYDVASGIVDIYRYNGTKVRTSSINDTVIESIFSTGKAQGSIYNVTPYQTWTTTIDSTWQYIPGNNYDTSNYLNLTIVSSGLIESYKYIDITKGISIDPTYGNDVEWNNEYENGLIQILFRAEDTFTAYHNDLIVSGNEISVSYTDGRYTVTLNDNNPVDIGTWRNIILNIDLLNGDLSVIPVRTFNSYSNVALDNTSIYVGKMTDAAPTNTIEWLGTTNSFTFNIYSTQVWLNTYGVVMLNPSLNITNYFTDLRNFYRLELSNFAAVGDSITINNVTGDISENVITFNDESLIINKLDITYADGHAYVSDANTTIDLGEITDNNVYMAGIWYFKSNLERGFTTEKQVYNWDWNGFILDNTQFAIFYIGLAIAGFVIAKRFCTFHVADYAFMIMSIVIALTVQVIA